MYISRDNRNQRHWAGQTTSVHMHLPFHVALSTHSFSPARTVIGKLCYIDGMIPDPEWVSEMSCTSPWSSRGRTGEGQTTIIDPFSK